MRLITMGFFITTSFNTIPIFLLYLILYLTSHTWLALSCYLSAMYVYYHFS